MTILDHAIKVLEASAPADKCAAAQDMQAAWTENPVVPHLQARLPERPGRPERPLLVPPREVPRRRLGSQDGRIALLHAVAHIEFNAIDLAADMIARYSLSPRLKKADCATFITDWVSVCADEARHFMMVLTRLKDLGSDYGTLPAHDGLWDAAKATGQDIQARLVIAPMVLEARGLDVTPSMIEKLKSAGDPDSAAVLQVIYDDEIGHVAAGSYWFRDICRRENIEPAAEFHRLVRTYFKGDLKPPFNISARDSANLPQKFYMPLVEGFAS